MTGTDLVFRNVAELKDLSQFMSVSSLLPGPLRGKPTDVAIIMMYGADIGLSPSQALQGIYVVDGRPTLAAQTWIALARKAKHRVFIPCKQCGQASEAHTVTSEDAHPYEPAHDAESCTVKIVRSDTGEEHTSTYTIADAETAQLTRKSNWRTHPRAMLLARAVSAGLRFLCPEIAMGFYVEGELDEPEPITANAERLLQDQAADATPADPAVIEATLADIVADFEDSAPATAEAGA